MQYYISAYYNYYSCWRKSISNDIYILWDNNIFNQKINYPIFSGLEVLPQELGDLLSTLPSDIYLFDETFKWAFALTHEDVNDKKKDNNE